MGDLLRMDYINSLPQPFIARFCGDKHWWPVIDIDVGTGLMRIDVCGLPQPMSFSEIMEIRDIDGGLHDPDDWYADSDAPAPISRLNPLPAITRLNGGES